MPNQHNISCLADSIALPEPEFGDKERAVSLTRVDRAMDGTPYTYIQKHPTKRLFTWTYDLPVYKGQEFLVFYERNHAEEWTVQRDREADTLVGYVRINPAALEMLRRGVTHDDCTGGNEVTSIEVQFEI